MADGVPAGGEEHVKKRWSSSSVVRMSWGLTVKKVSGLEVKWKEF